MYEKQERNQEAQRKYVIPPGRNGGNAGEGAPSSRTHTKGPRFHRCMQVQELKFGRRVDLEAVEGQDVNTRAEDMKVGCRGSHGSRAADDFRLCRRKLRRWRWTGNANAACWRQRLLPPRSN